MTGKLYGLGVGPGDPELLTIKALRLIKESDVIAVPGAVAKESVAYKIVRGVYEELDDKNLVPIPMPMTKDPAVLEENHKKAADTMENAESTDYSCPDKVFMGSVVTSGEAYMVATVIGDASELGKINKALTDENEEEEIQITE